MAADHLVQPLTVLCAELLIVLLVAFFWRLGAGGSLSAAAAVVAGSSAILMAIALAVAWGAHMRRQIPLKALLGLPRYIVSRAGNQASWLFRREQDWVRTPRAEERPEPVSPAEGDGDALPPATSPLGGTSRPVPPPTTPTDIAPGEHSHLVGARE